MEELIEKLTLIDERLSRIEAFMEKHRSDAISTPMKHKHYATYRSHTYTA